MKKMTAGDGKMHEFLINSDGELSNAAESIPDIRDFIEDLPETAATFRLGDIDAINPTRIKNDHVEFCKAWPMAEIYDIGRHRGRMFANPNYIYAHKYSDAIVECDCGAKLTRNYKDDHNSLRDEHNHAEDCLPQDRLRARAEMAERRHNMLVRLGRMGWKGSDMAPRLGASQDAMGGLAKHFNTTLRETYDAYREAAAHTYTYLVRAKGESAEKIADIYGHRRTTLTRWAQEYGEYETDRGENQFTRNDQGQFTWEQINRSEKPDFLKG